jgi:hypothetical protein
MLPEENMKIQLFEEIASGAPFVAPILVARLVKMQHDPDGAHALSSLGVTVNVRIAVGAIVGDPPEGAELTMQAQSGTAAFFPVFAGTLRVEPIDTLSSRLVLAGTYRVPLGVLGEVADRTLLAGTAKRSLQTFLGEARDEIAAAVLHEVMGH